jgi:SAM-dependent methyltransferase
LAAWYDSDEYQGSAERRGSAYVNYLEDEGHRIAEARRRYRNDLASYLPPSDGRVLEIGCATGSLLSVIRNAGHEVWGLDLSSRFADAAKLLYGIDVQVVDLRSSDVPEHHFDMVLLFGTLPALADLPGSLRRIRSLLKAGGILVANYAAADSFPAKAYGSRFWMFDPTVTTLKTSRGCRMVFDLAGLPLLRIARDWQMPSFRKVCNHAKLSPVLPVLEHLGLGGLAFPFPVPVPGVQILWAVSPAPGSMGNVPLRG